MDKILKRSEKLAFYCVDDTYTRMRGFTVFDEQESDRVFEKVR